MATQSLKHSHRAAHSMLLVAGFVALSLTTTRAENVIRVGYGEGSAGNQAIHVIVTASNDVPLHGYSIALSFPAEALELTDFSIDGTHVRGLSPEFVAPSMDNDFGVATLGVIFDFNPPLSTPSPNSMPASVQERIIGRLTFNIRADAPGGLFPLRLADGIGTPASYNRFTNAGVSITPKLEDGSFLVLGGNVLTLEKKIAFKGASPAVPITAYAQHPDALNGFSVGISYACDSVALDSATYDATDLGFLLGNDGKIEFFQTDVDDSYGGNLCRSRTAAIFDRVPPYDGQTLQPSPSGPTDQSLMVYRFRSLVPVDAPVEHVDLLLEEINSPGTINNTFVVGSSSITPRRVHGMLYFSQGTLTGRVVETVTGAPVGGAAVVTEPDGFIATTQTDGGFTMTGVTPGTYSLKVTRSGYYKAVQDGVVVRGANLVDNAGNIAMYAIPSGTTLKLFQRGLVNPDARADLSDVIYLLSHLFQGGPPPTCEMAADINGDRRMDLSDAIWFLQYSFAGGPPPPPPFETCGTHPDTGDLTCDSVPGC